MNSGIFLIFSLGKEPVPFLQSLTVISYRGSMDIAVTAATCALAEPRELRDDLLAAAAGGQLTGDQCEFVNEITAVTDAASLSCLNLHIEAILRGASE